MCISNIDLTLAKEYLQHSTETIKYIRLIILGIVSKNYGNLETEAGKELSITLCRNASTPA